MAHSIRFAAAIVSAVVLAAHAGAADTGMLYVKSNPSGATVVIEGRERGKTPVLVRGLPVGELIVELRIAGAKPVAKRVTVVAKRVAKIDVHIELPGASLTVVSEPLEATVFMDNREVGKTPLTLDHLDPGEYRLILLKEGYARTARSVVLAAGAERVLEVKLGTGGGEETQDTAPAEQVAKPRAPGRVPVEVQLILTMLKDAAAKGNFAETRRNMEAALRQPDMANFQDELRAGIAVTRALEGRHDAMRQGVEALVGKEVTFRMRAGSRRGRVEGTSVEGISIVSRMMISGRAAGESRGVVKWSDLTLAERDRLAASWKPEGPDGAVARVLLGQARGDGPLAAASGHPLGRYLGRGGAAPADEAAERAARSAWSRIARAKLSSVASAKDLLREIASFEEKYSHTRFASSMGEKLAAVKRYASAVSRLPRGAAHFGGHWYRVYEQKTTWNGAKRLCEEQGGHLVVITSKQESNFVKALARAMSGNGWIGLSDERLEGKWEWVTGEKVTIAPWGRGEPNNYRGEEDYAALAFARSLKPAGTWNDWSESRREFSFICEWEP